MTPASADAQAPPSRSEIASLKRLAAGIIRAQGNRFVKELLRDKGIRIGANKDDFNRNLDQAIESGKLRLDHVDRWLKSVEGWGNQHVYLYRIPPALRASLTEREILRRVKKAGLEEVWNGATLLNFPDKPKLTSISFANSVLRLVWQESSPGWTPVPDKNYIEKEGLDTYEYRAWRKIEWRAITRFEARLDDGIAAVFIADPIQGEEHQEAMMEVKRVVALLMDLPALEQEQFDIAAVSKNMDQRNLPTNARDPEVKAQKSRLGSGGAYAEFAAKAADKAYWEEPAIRDVRLSIRTQQLPVFEGTGGVFIFQKQGGLSRPLRVQLYSNGRRVRLWAEMNAAEVWTILSRLSSYQ